jgi:hypothetical protein
MLFKNTALSPEAQALVDRKERLKEILKPTGPKDRDYRKKCQAELKEVKKKLAKLTTNPPQNGKVRKPETSAVTVSSNRF